MKNKIDIDKWKEFKIGDLFDIHPTKAYKMNNSSLLAEDGINPVVVNSCYNNGIGGYTNYECTEEGNMITFSDTTSADSIFYQKDNFVGYPHVQGMYPIGKYKDKWSEYIYLFFVTLFREKAINLNYDYVNKFTRESAKEIMIKLPVDNKENPDWNYMERYMKNIEKQSKESIKKLISCKEESNKLDITKWREFKIKNIFNIVSPKVYHTREVKEDMNGIPYVVRSKFNNGIKYMVERDEKFVVNPKGVISFGAENASFFYQDKEYISGRDMYYIDTRNLSKNTVLFIIACLEKLTSKYSYNFGLFPKLLKEEKIKLPIKNNGEPDFEYMDKYMNELLSKNKNKLNCLNAI